MKIHIILLALLAAFAATANAQIFTETAALRISQVRYDPFPAEAGNYFDLFVTVENVGRQNANNVVCELLPRFPFSLDPGENAERSIGTLTAAISPVLFEYRVRTSADAIDGNNLMDFRCSTGGSSVTHELKINVESKAPRFAVGLVTSTPDEIKSDLDDVKLTVELQNVGEGDAKLTTVRLVLPEGFTASDSYSESYNLGTVSKDSSKEAVFFVDTDKSVTAGVHAADLILNYKDDNNNRSEYKEQTIPLNLNVKPSPIFSVIEIRAGQNTASGSFTGYTVSNGVVVNPSNLAQGERGELRVTIRNTGAEEAESVSVKIFKDSTHPFEFGEIYDFIGNLDANETGSAIFDFTVDDDAALKRYLLDVEVRFVEDSDVKTKRDTISLEVAHGKGDSSLIIVVIVVIIVAAGIYLWRKRK